MNVTVELANAGISKTAIEALRKQDLLDAELLRATSMRQLQSIVTLGMAIKIKKLFPCQQRCSRAKMPTRQLLERLAAHDLDAVKQARKRWQQQCIFVTLKSGALDVEATLNYLSWSGDHGTAPRFKNSEGVAAVLIDIDTLLNTRIALDPLTGALSIPGDPLADLDERKRLLVSFAVVANRIDRCDDPFTIRDQLSSAVLVGRWAQIDFDMTAAERQMDPLFERAKARLWRQRHNHNPQQGCLNTVHTGTPHVGRSPRAGLIPGCIGSPPAVIRPGQGMQ